MKKVNILFSLFFILSLMVFSLSAKEKKSPSGGTEPTSDKEIDQLHKSLSEKVVEYLGTDDKEELVIDLGRGMFKEPGKTDIPVFEETVTIGLSGGTPVSLKFYYLETTSKSIITQSRTIINPAIRDSDLGKIQVEYTSSMDNDTNFNLRDLKSASNQKHLLDHYKQKLKDTIRRITTYIHVRNRMERFTVDKILMLGRHGE